MSNHYDHNNWLSDNQKYLSLQLQQLSLQLKNKLALREGKAPENSFDLEKEIATLLTQMPTRPALEQLVQVFSLSKFEKDILLLCAAVELDSEFHLLIHALNGTGKVTFALTLSTFEHSHWSAITPGGALRYWKLIETGPSGALTHAPLKIDESTLHFLTGIEQLDEKLQGYASPVKHPEQSLTANLKNILKKDVKAGQPFALILFGQDIDERHALAQSVARASGRPLFVINSLNLPLETAELNELARLWQREGMLKKLTLLLECDTVDQSERQRAWVINQFISKIETPLIISTDEWIPVISRQKILVEIPRPTETEQLELWKQALNSHLAGTNGMLHRVVSQFNLSNQIIHRAASEWNGMITNEPTDDTNKEKKLWKICNKYASPRLTGLAQRIEPVASWDDLILPEQQKNVLQEIILHVKNRNTVYNQWGFSAKGRRGLGISALFAGESGTGKTMASEVLANELQLNLYKIDLSKVVNKYIGETEKNLRRIFDAAEDGGAILLFDEADALFGKRSEVKDSHDRYANIEVSYLLQRMETYRGLAILTTNMKTALDKAFLRRIRFIIQFPFPDAKQRAEIWRRVFPAQTPTASLDIDRLSKFTITGGNIRNIALNAAFLAAENGVVEMEHIFKAVKTEYAKLEMPLTTELKGLL